MSKKKAQKKIGGNYSGSRTKKDSSYEAGRKKTYMILSTAAIIIGLLLTGWQSMTQSRSNAELAYSDVTTAIREMREPVNAYASSASEIAGVSADSVSAVTNAYEALAAAGSAAERGGAEKKLSDALSALFKEADESGGEKSAYMDAREKVRESLDSWSEAAARYNEKAKAYNKQVTGFPTKFMAMIMRYGALDLIEV